MAKAKKKTSSDVTLSYLDMQVAELKCQANTIITDFHTDERWTQAVHVLKAVKHLRAKILELSGPQREVLYIPYRNYVTKQRDLLHPLEEAERQLKQGIAEYRMHRMQSFVSDDLFEEPIVMDAPGLVFVPHWEVQVVDKEAVIKQVIGGFLPPEILTIDINSLANHVNKLDGEVRAEGIEIRQAWMVVVRNENPKKG